MADAYVEAGIPFLRSLNVRPHQIDLAEVKYISPEFHARLRKSALQAGDVVIVRTGKPGTCAVVPPDLREANCSDVVIVRCGRELRPSFLSYWVNAMAGVHVQAHTVGAVQQHFNVASAKQLKIPVPALVVQDQVLAPLEAIDSRIALLRQTNVTLESIAQALFKSWFIDFDPVRAKAEGREPEGMDAATAGLFPSEFEETALGPIPRGWQAGTLADLSELNATSWTARSAPAEVAYIDLAGVKSNVFDPPQRYGFANAPSRARRVLKAGDTLVATVRPGNRSFGYIAEAEVGLTGSTGFAVLSPKSVSASAFVYLSATRPENIDRLAGLADGGAYPAVKPELVHGTRCTLPASKVLQAFDAVASPSLLSIAANAQRSLSLAAVRDTLLPRLISGKLRLPEARSEVEEALA